MKDFYRKFEIISKLPFWPSYLRWVYGKSIQDASSSGVPTIRDREEMACLLCGVSGEITANEFIKFSLKNNSGCKIIIIDLGQEQIESVKKLVKEKFPGADIHIKQANALNLGFIKDKSIDWIDTDGFFSFFDEEQLQKLFREWQRILKNDGYITFRELISGRLISVVASELRARITKMYMGIELQLHNTEELDRCINQAGFKSKRGISPIPLLDRYCLISAKKQ